MKCHNCLFTLFLSCSIIFCCSSCYSLLGFGIGASSDSGKPKIGAAYYSPDNFDAIPNGANIILYLKDGRQIKGEFLFCINNTDGSLMHTDIVLKQKGTHKNIITPIKNIGQIETRPSGNKKWTGLAIGGAIDIFFTVLIIATYSFEFTLF